MLDSIHCSQKSHICRLPITSAFFQSTLLASPLQPLEMEDQRARNERSTCNYIKNFLLIVNVGIHKQTKDMIRGLEPGRSSCAPVRRNCCKLLGTSITGIAQNARLDHCSALSGLAVARKIGSRDNDRQGTTTFVNIRVLDALNKVIVWVALTVQLGFAISLDSRSQQSSRRQPCLVTCLCFLGCTLSVA
jgi:hypothetical protein